jgi:hypothetical protein
MFMDKHMISCYSCMINLLFKSLNVDPWVILKIHDRSNDGLDI